MDDVPPTRPFANRGYRARQRTQSETTIAAASIWQGKSLEGDEDDFLAVVVGPRTLRFESMSEETNHERDDAREEQDPQGLAVVEIDVFGPVRRGTSQDLPPWIRQALIVRSYSDLECAQGHDSDHHHPDDEGHYHHHNDHHDVPVGLLDKWFKAHKRPRRLPYQ